MYIVFLFKFLFDEIHQRIKINAVFRGVLQNVKGFSMQQEIQFPITYTVIQRIEME